MVDVEIENNIIFVQQDTIANEASPTWKVVDDADEMNDWLLRRNKRHYQQMRLDNRPPMRLEFAPILSEQGTSTIVDDILDGNYDPAELGLAVKKWQSSYE